MANANPGPKPPVSESESLIIAPLSPEQIEALQAQAAKAEENWNNYVRAVADLDNYKKRAAREKQDAAKYANESLIQWLVPVLDNFEMALSAAQKSQNDSIQSLQA